MLELVQSLFTEPLGIFLLVFFVGFLGSGVNSFAGGGTFLAFPALLAAGLPPVIANATCKFAFIPGNLASAWAYRKYFFGGDQKITVSMFVIALIGGILGALLTLYLGNAEFKKFIPWLILGATLISWRGSWISNMLQNNLNSINKRFVNIVSLFLILIIALYGGFFGAGIGMLLIATLNIRGVSHINAINAIKNLMSVLINFAAVIMYLLSSVVDWEFGLVQMAGAIAGGYFGGVMGRSLDPKIVRLMITIVGFTLSIIYFYKYGYFSFL